MKILKTKKLPIFIFSLTLSLLLFCNVSAFASDYKYKVLDTKYNPSAEKLLDGTLETQVVEETEPVEKEGFDFLRFIAFITLFFFPITVLKFSCKTFVKVFDELKEKGVDYVEEDVKKEEQDSVEDSSEDNKDEENSETDKDNETQQDVISEKKEESIKTQKNVTKPIENKKVSAPVKPETKENTKAKETDFVSKAEKTKKNEEIVSKVTKPINSRKTKMLDKIELKKDKGLCIVEHEDKVALVGYINEKAFILKKFDSLINHEIRPRWTENVNNKDRYIVRLGTSYKALVEVGEKDINLLIEL